MNFWPPVFLILFCGVIAWLVVSMINQVPTLP